MSLIAEIKTLPRLAWVLFVGTLINRFGGFVLLFLVLFLKQEGYSVAQTGLVLSAYGVGGIGSALAGGFLADVFGRRNTIVLSMFSSAIVLVIIPYAHGLVALSILTGLLGFTAEMYRPAATALLTDLTQPHQRVTAFAVYRFAINLGFAIGPAVGGLMAEHSFSYLFLGDAVTSVIFGLVAVFALPNKVVEHEVTRGKGEAVRVILGDRPFLWFIMASTICAFIFMQHNSSFAFQVGDYGFSPSTYGLLISLNGIIITLVELPITSWTRRRSPRAVMTLGYALVAIGFGLVAWAHTIPMLVTTVVIWTFGEMVFFPVAAAHVANNAPADMRGRYHGAWTSSFGIGAVIAPIVGTALYGWIPASVWLTCFVVGAIGTWIVAVTVAPGRVLDPAEEVAEATGQPLGE